VPLEDVRRRGLDLDELECLARCNGADVATFRADTAGIDDWRKGLALAASGDAVIVASYDRAALGQTGSGHFSPIGGYLGSRDLALILDVARFKYPPHWVPAERLWNAMNSVDPTTGRLRGWVALRRRAVQDAATYSGHCNVRYHQGARHAGP
jgi:glutathione gamma-glutamylcysteinyltransferase